jgi:Mrp family chromosome partitioning ATPase
MPVRSAHKSRSRHGRVARTIAVTSPRNGEGKTTIAAQLALTLATDREKVAIVECDLRNRALDECGFGSQWMRSAPGLSDYLDKQATVRSRQDDPVAGLTYS